MKDQSRLFVMVMVLLAVRCALNFKYCVFFANFTVCIAIVRYFVLLSKYGGLLITFRSVEAVYQVLLKALEPIRSSTVNGADCVYGFLTQLPAWRWV